MYMYMYMYPYKFNAHRAHSEEIELALVLGLSPISCDNVPMETQAQRKSYPWAKSQINHIRSQWHSASQRILTHKCEHSTKFMYLFEINTIQYPLCHVTGSGGWSARVLRDLARGLRDRGLNQSSSESYRRAETSKMTNHCAPRWI